MVVGFTAPEILSTTAQPEFSPKQFQSTSTETVQSSCAETVVPANRQVINANNEIVSFFMNDGFN